MEVYNTWRKLCIGTTHASQDKIFSFCIMGILDANQSNLS